MVLVKHWSVVTEQVLTKQLRVQVPDLFDHVPHDSLFSAQLHRHCLDENGPHANHPISSSISQNLRSFFRFLHLRRFWERLLALSPRFL